MLGLILAAALTSSLATAVDEARIREAENRWNAAFVTGDAAYLGRLLATGYVSVGENGAEHPKTAVAAAVCAKRRAEEAERMAALRDDLVRQVLAAVPDAVLNGPPPGPGRLPGNAHFSFPGCEGDALLMLLDANGIACSTGSACTAGVAEPSHVLLAMGAGDARARGSLRFSLGYTSTKHDVDALALVIGEAVSRARRAAAR